MKNYKCLLVVMSLIYAFTACEKAQDLMLEDGLNEVQLRSKPSKMVSVPFKAKLFTGQADDALTEICSYTSPTDFWAMEHQVGGGTATHLGKFDVDLTFCFHVVLNEEGLPDVAGGFGEYNGAEGREEPIIIAANGDRLFAEVREESSMVPIQSDSYIFEFDDVWYITGGTGRFENASGEFVGHGMVRSDGTGTDHTWTGNIILPKKK